MTIIPARAGSKRFPRKNLATIGGKSLVQIAAEQAAEVLGTGHIYISTDSKEIYEAAGALPVWIKRPAYLSQDDTPSHLVVVHAAYTIPLKADDWVCLIQPTSPQRRPIDIMRCIANVYADSSTYTVSESKPDEPNGAVYIAKVEDWAEGFPSLDSFGVFKSVVMPDEFSLDIDLPEQMPS